MEKLALVHVENTENITEFAEFLNSNGYTIISANDTEELLKKQKIPVTHEPVLVRNGNYIHDTYSLMKMVLTSRSQEQDSFITVADNNQKCLSIVCMNVIPALSSFEDMHGKPNGTIPDNFFITSVIRNAYRNFENLLILTDPADYKEAMIQIKTDNISPDFRLYLAAKALNMVSAYDSAISDELLLNTALNLDFPNYLVFPFVKETNLKGGANSRQYSCLYRYPSETGALAGFTKTHGKELDYNQITDISLAWEMISALYSNLKNQSSVKSTNSDGYDFTTQFTPLTGTVFTIAVKLKSIVGAALSTSVVESFKKTYTYDKRNIKNVTLACSAVIDEVAAKEMVDCNFAVIVAPGFTAEAKQILSENKITKLIPTAKVSVTPFDMNLINGGLLVQTKDTILFDHWYVKTKNRPSQYKTDEMAFGVLLVSGSRSFSAALIKDNAIVGISQCSTSSVMAIEDVFYEAKRHSARNNQLDNSNLADILVCDHSFPFCEIVKDIIDSGVTAIIQTGGTETDEEFINYCNEHNVVMVYTGTTHITY